MRNQLHIQHQAGIAAVIKISFSSLHHKAARVTTIGAIGQGAAMPGRYKRNSAEFEIEGAKVHWVAVFEALLLSPGHNFKSSDELCACIFSNPDQIANVVAMAVRYQNII